MASLWTQAKKRMSYLLYGPGGRLPSTDLVLYERPQPPIRTSLVFDSHVSESSLNKFSGKSKLPTTISSAWDERDAWGLNTASRSWQGLTPQDRKAIMLDIYLNNSAASSCVDVISKRIFSGGVVVEKIDEEAPDNHQHYDILMEFLLRINPDWDFMQLGRSLIQDKLIFGESYAEIIWKGGLPWNLVKVDCPGMGYVANRWGQVERFYQELQSSQKRNWLDPNNIIRWWFPHPRSSIDPFAPVEKVTDAVVIDKKMMVWMMTFFQKGAKFPYHIEGAADQDEADRLQTFFLQNVMGEKNAHKLPVTWGNAKIVPTGNAGSLEMDFQKGMDRMDTMVYGAFGVPPAAVSIIKVGALGGNSGEDQDKSLIFNACDPVKQAFFEKLNDRITKRGFGITDYRISSHYADYRSDESVSKVEDTRIKNGSRTVDEIRIEGGKRPYKQGGDVPFIWSTKEVVPLARLGDLEDEQRQTAAAALQTAQAGADLAQTKAKQAKEPPANPPALLPAPSQQQQNPAQNRKNAPVNGNNQANNGKQNNTKQPAKPAAKQEDDSQRPVMLQQHTGVMVAFIIPMEIAQQITLPGGEPWNDLHITLGLLGEKDDLNLERLSVLRQALGLFAATSHPLQGHIAGVGRFEGLEGQPDAIIALPDIPGLPEFRQALTGILAHCGVPANAEHGYTPHITLMYCDKSTPTPIESVPNLLLNFNLLCLAVGDDQYFFPLLGQKQEATEPTYFTGKTELPQWTDPDEDQALARWAQKGAVALTWEDGPNPCETCLMNHGVTVKIGDPFPSGHRSPLVHPHCDCGVKLVYATQEEEDATQKLPVVKVQKKTMLPLTEQDTWEGGE